MTELYAEQWLFWIATNLFSIYLWWDEKKSIDIVVVFSASTVNSIVGCIAGFNKPSANQ